MVKLALHSSRRRRRCTCSMHLKCNAQEYVEEEEDAKRRRRVRKANDLCHNNRIIVARYLLCSFFVHSSTDLYHHQRRPKAQGNDHDHAEEADEEDGAMHYSVECIIAIRE